MKQAWRASQQQQPTCCTQAQGHTATGSLPCPHCAQSTWCSTLHSLCQLRQPQCGSMLAAKPSNCCCSCCCRHAAALLCCIVSCYQAVPHPVLSLLPVICDVQDEIASIRKPKWTDRRWEGLTAGRHRSSSSVAGMASSSRHVLHLRLLWAPPSSLPSAAFVQCHWVKLLQPILAGGLRQVPGAFTPLPVFPCAMQSAC
jgi:hypothetical protein